MSDVKFAILNDIEENERDKGVEEDGMIDEREDNDGDNETDET